MDDVEASGKRRGNGRGPARVENPKRRIWRAEKCLEEGCDRDPIARDLCGMHYQRRKYSGQELPPKKRMAGVRHDLGEFQCSVPGCVGLAVAHGLCRSHYGRSRRYGLGFEELAAMDAGKCESCDSVDDLHVDHCHDTYQVRGLLCGNCNKALGLLKDDPRILVRLAAYLERSTRDTLQNV